MMKATKYTPSFVDCRSEPLCADVSTTEELLKVSWIAEWEAVEGFSYFAKSGNLLMSILHGGAGWWTIARLSDPSQVDLPEWKYSNE